MSDQQGSSGVIKQENAGLPQYSVPHHQQVPQSKYSQLLAVIEELGKELRPTYTGNKMSAERLKRHIIHSRILVRECLIETERSARTNP